MVSCLETTTTERHSLDTYVWIKTCSVDAGTSIHPHKVLNAALGESGQNQEHSENTFACRGPPPPFGVTT